MKNLNRCRKFYEQYGAPMIHERFGSYENRIAVGMVGEGSDCFGFDDEISTDHDYGPGFCIWLTASDYRELQEELSHAYKELMSTCGQKGMELYIDRRRGVFSIDDFYEQLLGMPVKQGSRVTQLSAGAWLQITEDKLATAVNGAVFRDDLGEFTSIREYLSAYYPDSVWKYRIATELYHFSQNAQSNYARMMARQDYVTANICIMQAIKAAMALIYLLNRRYAPYYKWMRRGISQLPILSDLGQLFDAMAQVGCQSEAWEGREYNPFEVNLSDPVVRAFEVIAGQLLAEMVRQGLVQGDNPFLDIYSRQLMSELGSTLDTGS